MELNGSQIVLECLLEQGVDTVFGYPGGAILNIYDALYHYQDKIHHVLTSHEQGAAHAADGYARATGKVGVCMATSGPGATNLVTGIATAYMDSIPVVAITCNVGTPLLGKDSFQEIDIAGVVMPITKHSFIVKDITKLADTIRRAFKIAQSGRPGPVLVDITKDVTGAMYEYEAVKPEAIKRVKDTITETDLTKALKLIKKSERPMVLVGGGAVTSGGTVLRLYHNNGLARILRRHTTGGGNRSNIGIHTFPNKAFLRAVGRSQYRIQVEVLSCVHGKIVYGKLHISRFLLYNNRTQIHKGAVNCLNNNLRLTDTLCG